MTEEPTLTDRLRSLGSNSGDEYVYEVCGRAADELDRLTRREARLTEIAKRILRHQNNLPLSTLLQKDADDLVAALESAEQPQQGER